MTVNAAYDYLRKRKRRAERRMSDLTEQQMTSADASAGMLQDGVDRHRTGVRERLDELLAGVSEEDRILLLMKEVEGLSLKELEAVYRVNGNALKVRLFRARQRALKAFAARENEGEGSPEPKRKAVV
jgi:RNA polymerase sigma-70 factor (ECF subfamily)